MDESRPKRFNFSLTKGGMQETGENYPRLTSKWLLLVRYTL
jgi:hypothetical protein